MEYAYIGKNLPLNNGPAKATGRLQYVGDIHLPRMMYMKLVLSPVAHGIVRSLNTRAAEELQGVAAVLTYENTTDKTYDRSRTRGNKPAPDQETLFVKHVRFAGDRIAAVIAETPEIARKAAELIHAEIDPLPFVLDPDQARKGTPYPIHEKNSVMERPDAGYGDYSGAEGEEFFHHSATQRVSHVTMETHCAVADYDPSTDHLTVYTATQDVYASRCTMSALFHMPLNHIRVIKTPMGGSFGSRHEMVLEPLAACGAKAVGRPVMLQFDRRESMLCTFLKHPVKSDIHAKFTSGKKLAGLSIDCQLDAGAYQTCSPAYADAIYTRFSWVYDVPNLEYRSASVCTNAPTSGSFRGWGSPEASYMIENMLNAAARKFSLDPIDLRMLSALEPNAVSRIGNYPLGNLPLKEALEKGRERFCWDERKADIASQDRTGRYLRGIGMAAATHTSGYYPRKGDWATVVVKMEEDGTVYVNCPVHDYGCGEVTAFQAIAGETLSISPDAVEIFEADTAYNAYDNGCFSSRVIYVMGRAVMEACKKLLERLKINAAEMLQCSIDKLSFADGEVFITNEPEHRCTYSQIAYYVADRGKESLFISHTYVPETNPGPAAVHFAEVEVDTYTGLCRVADYLAVHDVGTAINPEICRGQVGSALQQGIGMVFCEGIKLDPKSGRVTNADLQRYHVARACDLPQIDVLLIEHPDEEGPYGAKSIGEACFAPVGAALTAAVNDALSTDLTTLPLEPDCILNALNAQRCRYL